MSIDSRQKGAVGERELANYLKGRGVEARRGQQFSGGNDSPDVVVPWPDVHLEVKRTERFKLYDAIDQARRDSSGTGKVPLVVHRCNDDRRKQSCRGEWLVVISLDDFLAMKRNADTATAILGEMV